MEKQFPADVHFTRPNGGLFIWFDLPNGLSGKAFTEFAAKKGVACVPGSAFDLDQDPSNSGVRLNFSVPSFEQIESGITILSECLKQFMSGRS